MNSPKQRIQRLKKEIEDLGQQITTNPNKKSFNLPLHSLISKPNPEREEMQQKINSLRLQTSGREQTLQSQLKEISQNLRSLAIKKQTEVSSSKSSRDSYKKKIDSLKLGLQKLSDDYQQASASMQEKQRILENSTVAKAKVYDESLIPLEKDEIELRNIKQSLSGRMLQMTSEENRLHNALLMCYEDISMQKIQKFELVGLREEHEAKLEIFSQEFFDEIEFFKAEDEYYRKIMHIHNLQNKYRDEVCLAECNLQACVANIERSQDRVAILTQEIREVITNYSDFKINVEIGKLEEQIQRKCEELGAASLESTILELNTLERFDIDEEILKIQLAEVRAFENQLRQRFEYEEKAFSETLIIQKYEKKPTEAIEDAFRLKKIEYRNRLAAICQWKEEVECIVFEFASKSEVLIKDKTILQEIQASISRFPSSEQKKELESLLTQYALKVSNRDKIIQNYSQALKEKSAEKLRTREKLLKLKQEWFRFSLDVIRARQQVQILLDKERSINNEYKSIAVNSIIQGLLSLRNAICLTDSRITAHSKTTEILHTLSQDLQSALKSTRRESYSLKLSINEISEELQAIHYQIEKIYEKKSKNFSSPSEKSSENDNLSRLVTRIEELSSDLEIAQQDSKTFDSDFQLKLSLIEQEESMLRSQQQAIESALRNIESEAKRIKEMEWSLGKYDDADAAPKPEAFRDQNRSRSAAKLRKNIQSEDYFTNEIRDGDETTSIVEGSQFLELVVKPLGKNLAITTDRGFPQPVKSFNKKYYRFNLEDISQSETNFLDRIKPLLEGAEIYKKFLLKNAKSYSNDVLDLLKTSPENSGYALRQFFLHKSLAKINVIQPLKPGFESVIATDSLMAPILSQSTILVLKAQGYLNSDELEYEKLVEKSKEPVGVEVNSERFRSQCRSIVLYPFSIGLMNGEKVDLVAKGYQMLKEWVNGLNALAKYKRYIPKLRARIEAYTTV